MPGITENQENVVVSFYEFFFSNLYTDDFQKDTVPVIEKANDQLRVSELGVPKADLQQAGGDNVPLQNDTRKRDVHAIADYAHKMQAKTLVSGFFPDLQVEGAPVFLKDDSREHQRFLVSSFVLDVENEHSLTFLYSLQNHNLAGTTRSSPNETKLHVLSPKSKRFVALDIDAEENTWAGNLSLASVYERSEPLVSAFIQVKADCQLMSLDRAYEHLCGVLNRVLSTEQMAELEKKVCNTAEEVDAFYKTMPEGSQRIVQCYLTLKRLTLVKPSLGVIHAIKQSNPVPFLEQGDNWYKVLQGKYDTKLPLFMNSCGHIQVSFPIISCELLESAIHPKVRNLAYQHTPIFSYDKGGNSQSMGMPVVYMIEAILNRLKHRYTFAFQQDGFCQSVLEVLQEHVQPYLNNPNLVTDIAAVLKLEEVLNDFDECFRSQNGNDKAELDIVRDAMEEIRTFREKLIQQCCKHHLATIIQPGAISLFKTRRQLEDGRQIYASCMQRYNLEELQQSTNSHIQDQSEQFLLFAATAAFCFVMAVTWFLNPAAPIVVAGVTVLMLVPLLVVGVFSMLYAIDCHLCVKHLNSLKACFDQPQGDPLVTTVEDDPTTMFFLGVAPGPSSVYDQALIKSAMFDGGFSSRLEKSSASYNYDDEEEVKNGEHGASP